MTRVFSVLTLVGLIFLLISCAAPQEALKGTGEGTEDIIEGTGKGLMEAGKGAGETVVGTAKTTGQVLTGQGEKASESGKVTGDAASEGVKGVVTEPLKGLEKGLKSIDAGIKRSTGREDVK